MNEREDVPWTAAEEEVVVAYLAGDLSADDGRVVELLQRNPALGRELDALRRTESLLEAAAARDRSHRRDPDARAVASARELVDRELSRHRSGRRRPWMARPLPWVLLAAAVVVSAVTVRWASLPGEQGGAPQERMLGTPQETAAPAGTTPEQRTSSPEEPPAGTDEAPLLEWEAAPGTQAFVLLVYDEGGDVVVDREFTGDVTSWSPGPDEAEDARRGATYVVLRRRFGFPDTPHARGTMP